MHFKVDGANNCRIAPKSFEAMASATLRANACCSGVPLSAASLAARCWAERVGAPCGTAAGARIAHGDSCGFADSWGYAGAAIATVIAIKASVVRKAFSISLLSTRAHAVPLDQITEKTIFDGEINLCRGSTSIARAMRSLRYPTALASRRAATTIHPNRPWA